jgi:hypothetical protein
LINTKNVMTRNQRMIDFARKTNVYALKQRISAYKSRQGNSFSSLKSQIEADILAAF